MWKWGGRGYCGPVLSGNGLPAGPGKAVWEAGPKQHPSYYSATSPENCAKLWRPGRACPVVWGLGSHGGFPDSGRDTTASGFRKMTHLKMEAVLECGAQRSGVRRAQIAGTQDHQKHRGGAAQGQPSAGPTCQYVATPMLPSPFHPLQPAVSWLRSY